MTAKKHFSIVVCHYDTKVSPENQPKPIAQRCSAEIISLCEQLSATSQQLSKTLRQKDIEDIIRSCEFHYENLLFRVYSLRERAWDVLAALADVSRKQTGDKKFRDAVLAVIANKYPEVYKALSELQILIDADLEIRNVATHQTFLFLGIAPEDDPNNFYEPYSVLYAYDPQSKEGIAIQKSVRKAIREFVRQHERHFQEIRDAAFNLEREFQGAIHSKVW